MDSNRFDDLTRSLANRRDRRSVLKTLGAAAFGAAGVFGLGGAASAGKADKVSFCHLNDEGTYDYITVSMNAAPAHRRHGDIESPDFATDLNNCGACGNVCTAPDNAMATCGESGCSFTCNTGYELNETDDGCVATALCPPGYEALNGGCFEIVSGLNPAECEHVCTVFGSVRDSGNYLCGTRASNQCNATADCPEGQACYHFNDQSSGCIAVC